jgi:hypothetical protein
MFSLFHRFSMLLPAIDVRSAAACAVRCRTIFADATFDGDFSMFSLMPYFITPLLMPCLLPLLLLIARLFAFSIFCRYAALFAIILPTDFYELFPPDDAELR